MAKDDDWVLGQPNAYNIVSESDFEHLYKGYWKSVFGIIYHYVQDHEIASELTQELFATIWERRNTINLEKNIQSYLFRSAKLEAFDYIRTNVRRKQLLADHTAFSLQQDNTTLDTLMYNELRSQVNQIISALPPRCREVYLLSQNDGLNNHIIANKLLISEKTVEYHLYKAMAVLRDYLTGYE